MVAEAVSDGAKVVAELGEPEHAGITPIYRSPELTIINFAWGPCMSLMPHNHPMFSVVGIYSGREDNVLWERTPKAIEAVGTRSLGVGDVAILDRDVIHSVLNPIAIESLPEHTKREEWIGGSRKMVMNGENLSTLDGLKAILDKYFRLLDEPVPVPFVIESSQFVRARLNLYSGLRI